MTLFKKTLALLLCLAMAMSIVACGGGGEEPTVDLGAIEETMAEGDKDCVHVWGDWEDHVESTCTTDGLAIRTCELCGKQESEKLPAYGHDVSSGKCMECGKKIKKCDHEDTDTVVIKAATCTEKGKEHEVCTECFTIVDENKVDALGHSMVYYDYKDATCTEIGWYSHEACENCGMNDREEIQPYGHKMAAGTCTVCAYVDTSFEIVTAPGMSEVSHTVTGSAAAPYNAEAAKVDSIDGSFEAEKEVDTYTLTVSVNGYYRLWFTEIYSGNKLDVYVLNSLGETVKYDTWMQNNNGITAELKGGETYTIQVKQRSGIFTYRMNVGYQKASADVSAYDVINDSISYVDQANVYTFTPAAAGTYRFELAGMMAEMQVDLYIYDRLGYEAGRYTYCNNGEGITKSDFAVGETYTIVVYERSNLGNYTLNIRKPSAPVDITNYNTVHDSITYDTQVNTYTFTAANTTYSVAIDGLESGERVKLYVYDKLGTELGYDSNCYSGDGFSLTNLVVGEVYTVKVEEKYDLTPYTLRLFTAKDPFAVSSNMGVNDTISYEGQINTYKLTVDEAGEHEIYMANVEGGGCFSVAVYGSNGVLIADDYYMYAGDSFSIGNLAVGDELTITVTEYDYKTSYTLSIQ